MFRLVLAGDAGAGKSSFLLRLTLNEFRGDIQATLGGRPPSRQTPLVLLPVRPEALIFPVQVSISK